MTIILNGLEAQSKIKERLYRQIKSDKLMPKLAILQIGDNHASNLYIKEKIKFGELIGAKVIHRKIDEHSSESDVLKNIEVLNKDKTVNGIIIQLPIPKKMNQNKLLEAILPEKDVDALSSENFKLLALGRPRFVPATAKGIKNLLDFYNIGVDGKHIVIVGRSMLVGKPTALLMLNFNATVTLCHSKTINLSSYTREADIIISAAGIINLINQAHVKAGQTVIDVGINLLNKTKLNEEISGKKIVGDVDFGKVSKIVNAISPVPGGVGPMTVAALFENLITASNI